jgi:CRISPR-associated protein Csm2
MANLKKVMTDDPTGEELVEFAQETANKLRRLKKNQIRNVFTEVRRIQTLWESDPAKAARRLKLLQPKLYYQTQRKREVGPLKDVLTTVIDYVVEADDQEEQKARFDRFVELFEAILAYHR